MGAKNSTHTGMTYLKLKAKTSDTDATPYFGRQEKVNGEYEIVEKFNSVDGNLVEISHETYPYEDEVKTKAKMVFQDPDGKKTIVESNFNNLLYGILNSIAGCATIGKIDIQVWLGAAKQGSDKRYASAAVTNDGEKAGWKYEYATLPKPQKIKAGNKTVTDDSYVIDFFTKLIDEEIKPKLPAPVAAPAAATPVAADAAATDTPPAPRPGSQPTDDLPF